MLEPIERLEEQVEELVGVAYHAALLVLDHLQYVAGPLEWHPGPAERYLDGVPHEGARGFQFGRLLD